MENSIFFWESLILFFILETSNLSECLGRVLVWLVGWLFHFLLALFEGVEGVVEEGAGVVRVEKFHDLSQEN